MTQQVATKTSVGGAMPLNVGSLVAYDPSPYRPAREASGVLCPGSAINAAGEDIECESPLTSRLRGGRDTQGRPLGQYLCETCGTVFVALTVSLPAHVLFDEVAVPDDNLTDHEHTPIAVSGAVRRGERLARTAPRLPAPEPRECPECGAGCLGAKDLAYHLHAHHQVT